MSKCETSYDWAEISKHNNRHDRWLVIDGGVYDVTRWAYKHPGGSSVIGHYAGQDASEPFRAFHPDLSFVKKHLKALRIGSVRGIPSKEFVGIPLSKEKSDLIKGDFEILRNKVTEMGLFNAKKSFFFLMLGHIIFLEVMAYLTMLYFGTSWLPYLVSIAFYSIVQAQASWLQHDFGHLSVFQSRKWNHFFHQFTMSFTKGASAKWWSHMHYQHHSKPNVMDKDPDVRLKPLFVVGDTMAKETAINEPRPMLPYQLQHKYFFAIGPPLLFPVYFQSMTFKYAISRRCYQDLFWMGLFFAKLFALYGPMLGFGGTILYYFIVRMAESHWFTWVSQSNHIPMDVDYDRCEPWLCLQMKATCDIEQSAFNDWFTGHLNFQIEHHLFPTMPRHNYNIVRPLVRELCEKHGIDYSLKPLMTAFRDVVKSLKSSGEIWYAAYHAHHLMD